MTVLAKTYQASAPSLQVQVTEGGRKSSENWVSCEIGTDLGFDSLALESYCLSAASNVGYDLLVLAAAVEFCDRSLRRPELTWTRHFELRLPVHEPDRWHSPPVVGALQNALDFLTGDRWTVSFSKRRTSSRGVEQGSLKLPIGAAAVIPYSDGMDSRAVSALVQKELGTGLVRVRMSPSMPSRRARRQREHFAAVPYKVRTPSVESSARSRGFKFALIGGLAAHLLKADRVVLPESGQGALGPALISVGQAYPDYRNHPRFLRRVERFLDTLLGEKIRYEMPRLWFTKGETLAQYAQNFPNTASWSSTRSCWRQQRQVSVSGKWRQCGICAACLLRRLSIHAAGLSDSTDSYVWGNLSAASLAEAADAKFGGDKDGAASRSYAVAAVLHLDHLASFRHEPRYAPARTLAAAQLADALGEPYSLIQTKMNRMLEAHENEWAAFLRSMEETSFIRRLVPGGLR